MMELRISYDCWQACASERLPGELDDDIKKHVAYFAIAAGNMTAAELHEPNPYEPPNGPLVDKELALAFATSQMRSWISKEIQRWTHTSLCGLCSKSIRTQTYAKLA